MNIPVKGEYALKALLELSLHWPKEEPLGVSAIALRQGIPLKFLTQILLNLKSLGLVRSVRGKQGGYVLRKSPAKISLADVLNQYISISPKRRSASVITNVLGGVDDVVLKHLSQITFDKLLKQDRALTKAPMYTI